MPVQFFTAHTLTENCYLLFQCDVEVNFLEGQVGLPSTGGHRGYVPHPQQPQHQQQPPQPTVMRFYEKPFIILVFILPKNESK